MEYLIIILFCVGACYEFYQRGIKEGCHRTVEKLHEAKIIAFDNKGEIYPNPFFKA